MGTYTQQAVPAKTIGQDGALQQVARATLPKGSKISKANHTAVSFHWQNVSNCCGMQWLAVDVTTCDISNHAQSKLIAVSAELTVHCPAPVKEEAYQA